MKISRLLLLSALAASAFAQDTTPPPPSSDTPNPFVSLAGSFFEHNYFNVFGYGSGVYDSYIPVLQPNGQTTNGSVGYDVGGGINAYHAFHDGSLGLSYSGDYRNYINGAYGSGTSQSLGFGLSKRLSRHISFALSLNGGISYYGQTYYATEPSPVSGTTNTVISNPFASQTRYAGTGVSLSYQQTRRLSYFISGSFSLQRYNFANAIGATGGSGSAGVSYRLQPRTTLTGSYGHTYYVYTQHAGSATVDGFGLTLSHTFLHHWSASVSGGISRSNASGSIAIPVNFFLGQGSTESTVTGYALGAYHETVEVPTFNVFVAHGYRKSSLNFSAGEGVAGSGNGYYLTSRNEYVTGFYSFNPSRRTNMGVGGSYNRLSSVANAISSGYNTITFSANYGTMLFRYFGVFARYDYLHYDSVGSLSGVSDNRISFGVNFSSRRVPMTLF